MAFFSFQEYERQQQQCLPIILAAAAASMPLHFPMAAASSLDQQMHQQQLQQLFADSLYPQPMTNQGGSHVFNHIDVGPYNYQAQQQQQLNAIYAQHFASQQQRLSLQQGHCSPPDVKRPRLSSITQQPQLQMRASAVGHVTHASNEQQRALGASATSAPVLHEANATNNNQSRQALEKRCRQSVNDSEGKLAAFSIFARSFHFGLVSYLRRTFLTSFWHWCFFL